jgi:hypothetical protein
LKTDLGSVSHFPAMSEQAVTGNVGGSFEAHFASQLTGIPIQDFHPGNCLKDIRHIGFFLFQGSCGHAKPKRFGDEKMVTRLSSSFGEQILNTNTAEHDQTKFGFLVTDGMTAGDHHPGIAGGLRCPAQDILLDRDIQIGREGSDVQRKKRLPTHGIDIGQAVGSGNRPVIIGVIDHRGKEIGGQDQGSIPVELPDRGIIRGVQTDQELGMVVCLEYGFKWSQNLLQRVCAQLGCSTSAGCQAGQPDLAPTWALGHLFIILSLSMQ